MQMFMQPKEKKSMFFMKKMTVQLIPELFAIQKWRLKQFKANPYNI